MDDTKLYILPSDDYKLIEFVTRGETELDEISGELVFDKVSFSYSDEESGRIALTIMENIDDIGKYEVQYEQGIAVKANRQFGVWTITP